MQIVIDTNVILAMLIRPGKPIDTFFNQRLQICAPALLFSEIENNKDEAMEKTRLDTEEFELLYNILKANTAVIPEGDFLGFRELAKEICPDPKDIVFFALALYLKCPIWSNEKKLKKQEVVIVYATHELMDFLGTE